MLDKMREGSQGVAAKVVLSVIILSFALAGVSGYLGSSSQSAAVLVNDQEISRASVEQAYKNERSRLQEQYGEQFDVLASNPNFAQQVRAQATQTLISESLIGQAISEMGLRIGDEQVKNKIRNMTEFQVEGKFNNDKYLSLLRRATYTPVQFSASVKQDLARSQLLKMLVGSEFVVPQEVNLAAQLQMQKRVAKILTVNATAFENNSEVSADEIQAYYDNNSQLFQYPEQVSVDYVLLDASQLTLQTPLSDADIETYYDTHQSDYQRVERRKVAHILVKGDDSIAQQKALDILDQLEKGADFAKLATEKSEDAYSAKNKGELDWFERGVMDPAFNDAAFTLTKEASLSGLVKSTFGYHIIKLLDIQAAKTLPLADVKIQVKKALHEEKSKELYYDLQQRLSEVAFESPDNLDEAAGVVSGEVQHTELFSADQAPELLTEKAILSTVFDSNFREEGMNSEVIELSENKAIVVRINDFKAASTQPLSEVSDVIAAQLSAEKSRSAAQAFVEAITAKLNAQESVAAELAEKNIEFSKDLTFERYNHDYDYQVVQKVFKLAKPTADQVSRDWAATSTGDYVVIELSKVIDSDPSVNLKVKDQISNMLNRSTAEATYQALVAQLMANADIKYLVAN
ncbi:peptidylprolyl isomerase [Psychromonas antarctica]|uniref:peptidylprolyl isomerase n=1 Tax=Psychromonas antarctica TaxID=67573 RepID=UPI001EE98D14|nr:peptidylprolyl isomerase [Psychromonas antarctica]MCG6202570.1 peptidylprolyl isomerase [Psychromonas antarctica]